LAKRPGRYHDGHGLILVVVNSNNASWQLRFQRNGRERWLGLGPLHTVTLKDARERARAARLQLLDGIDPIDVRRAERAKAMQVMTFKAAAEAYNALHEHVVEQALAHTIGNAVEAAYRRGDLFEKRRHLMNDWAQFCGRPSAGADAARHGEAKT
jgi:hypothetical protein